MEPVEFASKFINNTNRHIFLTGKAGTGKTTFLRRIIHETHKNVIVAAPTGIAAINAGGITLHSLFQLPFGAFIPSDIPLQGNIQIQLNTPKSLFNNFQMHKAKRSLLQELELLIIDEVSMLRADLLDAIDTVLKSVRRRKNIPFGGVQILFIGDLLQLPPVVKTDEEEYLKPFYSSMYFFNAKALQHNQPVYLEFEKIYRQSDKTFIALLNNLRANKISQEDVLLLNKYYKPGFEPDTAEGYIQLTTHNHTADTQNRQALQKLPGKSFFFEAETSGDFSEYLYPVDPRLELKKGAQVMFLKNDYSGEKRYYNGKIGKVTKLDKHEIVVSFEDGSPSTTVEPYVWENKKYSLNKETNEIEEKQVGAFSHYPIKLAWAITVHKSQGLTFAKAIIDVSKAFAPGQIYVALSRLTSLDGLVLTAPIPNSGLAIDASIRDYTKTKELQGPLDGILDNEARQFIKELAIHSFDFSFLLQQLDYHIESYNKDENRSVKQQHKQWAIALKNVVLPLKSVGDKFQVQLKKIVDSADPNYLSYLQERILSAQNYYKPLFNKLSENVLKHMDGLESQTGIKAYKTEVKDLERLFFRQLQHIYKAKALIDSAIDKTELSKSELLKTDLYKERKQSDTVKGTTTKTKKKAAKETVPKSDTKLISYNLYKEGKNLEEIAAERTLTVMTIEGHLAHFIKEGQIDVFDLVEEKRYKVIVAAANHLETTNLAPIKEYLSNDFSYTELRMAIAGYLYAKQQN